MKGESVEDNSSTLLLSKKKKKERKNLIQKDQTSQAEPLELLISKRENIYIINREENLIIH